MRKSAVVEKCCQIGSYFRHTHTPYALTLDSLRMKRSPFVASSKSGLKLALMPSTGESFTFYENVIRRDYLNNGITLHPGDTVVDIGANFGSFAVLAGRITGPTGRVIAFEPVAETFDRLQSNVKLNGLKNIECRREAVDANDGAITLQKSSKSAFATAHTINSRPMEEKHSSETVPCVTLGRIVERLKIDRINLLKIDCEGSEYGIFETLSPETASRIDQITMEVHSVHGKSFKSLCDRLISLGFGVRHGFPLVALRN